MRRAFFKSKSISLILIAIIFVLPRGNIFAADLGKVGNTFSIKEEGFVEMMKRKLAAVDIEAERKKMENTAREKIENPTPVFGINIATKDRTFYFDPSYILDKDAVLPCGKILHKAGTKVNPLEHMDLNRRIFFIDGREESQIEWLQEQLNNPLPEQKEPVEDRVILVGGSVFKSKERLGEDHENKIFFDQKGDITTRFSIKYTPAIAQQEGLKIRIDEINLSN